MLKPVSRKVLIQKLRKLGFAGPYSGGRHQFMEKGDFKIFVPNPHAGDIGKVLLGRILKEIDISGDEFMRL